MTDREHAVKQVAELVSDSPEGVEKALIGEMRFMQQTAQTLINYAVTTTERVLELEAREAELLRAVSVGNETVLDLKARVLELESALKRLIDDCCAGQPCDNNCTSEDCPFFRARQVLQPKGE